MNTKVDPQALQGYASRLRNASTELEGMAKPPKAPEAEQATPILAGMLSNVSTSIGQIVKTLGAAGDAVSSGSGVFQDTEDTNTKSMKSLDQG